MNAQTATAPTLAKLREPFPDHHISKLPKETKAQIDERKANRASAFKCPICGGWHHKQAVHLDYVGHAALTDRLLDTDLEWSWEPVAFTPEGLPAFDRIGGLWIRLTVCGVTRLGYGAADGKTGGDAVKEIIGDALRNAAMRFGAALDLWHKGDLHAEEDETTAAVKSAPRSNGNARPAANETADLVNEEQLTALQDEASAVGADLQRFCNYFGVTSLKTIPAARYHEALAALQAKRKPAKQLEAAQ